MGFRDLPCQSPTWCRQTYRHRRNGVFKLIATRAGVGRSRTTTVHPPSWWRRATPSLCMDRLDRSKVEIKASRDARTGFIRLDHSGKKNPQRPQIEASRGKVQKTTDSGFWERQEGRRPDHPPHPSHAQRHSPPSTELCSYGSFCLFACFIGSFIKELPLYSASVTADDGQREVTRLGWSIRLSGSAFQNDLRPRLAHQQIRIRERFADGCLLTHT